MDASNYLARHGWSGGGLGHKQSGIKKPILASQKQGLQGLGGKPLGGYSDQWWLGAFDAGLKNLQSDGTVTTPPPIAKGATFLKTELYRKFVRGENLDGTIREAIEVETGGALSPKAENSRKTANEVIQDESLVKFSKSEKYKLARDESRGRRKGKKRNRDKTFHKKEKRRKQQCDR